MNILRSSPFPASREEASREFGDAMVGAMDEIAELLFATRQLVETLAEYQTVGLLKPAEPLAIRIEQAVNGVRADLLEAIRLGPRDTMEERLHKARKANALRIAQAGKDAASLTALNAEQSADVAVEGPRDTSAARLQFRIERLAASWATL